MRAVIGRKGKYLAGNDRRKSVRRSAEAGKALRAAPPAAEAEQRKAAGKGAARYFQLYRSSAKILIRLAGCMRASRSAGSKRREQRGQHRDADQFEQLQREHIETAAASRTLSR